MCFSWCSCGHRLSQDMARSEWEPGEPCQGLEKWLPQKMCVERERHSFHGMFLDVTDPLDFKRLISVGNPSKMINVFCWSTFTRLVSPACVKISEICSICKYISVVSMAVAIQFTLASSHTQPLACCQIGWCFYPPSHRRGKGKADDSKHLLSWSVWLHSWGPKILSLNHHGNSARGQKCLMRARPLCLTWCTPNKGCVWLIIVIFVSN